MGKRIVVIVLGNRLNDDGTLSEIGKERLMLASEIEQTFHPDYYILSGGLANETAGITEAEAMYNYLIEKHQNVLGFDKEKFILEKKSLSTVGNAKYSVPIAKELGAEIIIVCSSAYHFGNPVYKAVESFVKELEGSNIALMTYCK